MIDPLSLLADNSLDKFDSRYRMVLVAAHERSTSCKVPSDPKPQSLPKKRRWL